MTFEVLAGALLIGFLGSTHCIGMCGGISGALGLAPASGGPVWRYLWGYSAGRIMTYGLIGALVGAFGAVVAPSMGPLRVLAGVMLILMALYLADWWRGLVWLERGGAVIWRRLQPLGRALLPVRSTGQSLLLGALWGWLPCGLVYSALTYALAQGDALASGATMVAFGLGTLPAVLLTGAAAAQTRQWVQKKWVRNLSAVLLLLFGAWTIWGASGHAGHGGHSGHEGHDMQSEPVEKQQHHHHGHH